MHIFLEYSKVKMYSKNLMYPKVTQGLSLQLIILNQKISSKSPENLKQFIFIFYSLLFMVSFSIYKAT